MNLIGASATQQPAADETPDRTTTMNKPKMAISAIIIGCGAFARRYHVPSLLADPAIRLAAIVDPQPGEAVRALARDAGALLVDDVEQVPAPDGAVMALVSSPHMLHAGHVAAALARGWHVLCDKPFVLHLAEAEALAREADRRNLVNAVAFNRRLDRGGLAARAAIQAGRIGAVRFVQTIQLGYPAGGWLSDPALGGGGPFSGRGTHLADFVPWLIDSEPNRVRARIRGGSAMQVDDGGFIELQFGAVECQIACLREGWRDWDEIRVFGEDGMIELRRPLKFPLGWQFALSNRRGAATEMLEAEPVDGASTRAFIAAMRGEGRVACSFAEAFTSVAVIEQAFASARTDGGWRDLPR